MARGTIQHPMALIFCNRWTDLSGKQRAVFLRAISKKIQDKKDMLAKLETQDCGKPYREAAWDMDDVAGCFDYCKSTTFFSGSPSPDAGLAEELDGRQNEPVELPDSRFKTVIQYCPVGVVAAIIPWNYVSCHYHQSYV